MEEIGAEPVQRGTGEEHESQGGKATLEGKLERNAEGGIEAEGVAPHERHPRSSPDPKGRAKKVKPAKAAKTTHARTRKAKSTTHSHR